MSLYSELQSVEKISNLSKLGRLLHHPARYLHAIFYWKFIYPKTKKEKRVRATLFFGKEMTVALPAATDIYLTGGKSHPSEIRLAKFMINYLAPGDHFLDIGAHYGYFSLLASAIVGPSGHVLSFEPTQNSYQLLERNTATEKNITIFPKAVYSHETTLTFYQFPNLYAEYNTIDIDQFKEEPWYQQFPPVEVAVPATTIDQILATESVLPKLIKIDVEGAEYHAIQGALASLSAHKLCIALEYLNPKRHNEEHRKALTLFRNHGYHACFINLQGSLEPIDDIDNYLMENNLDSENIVLRKGG